MLANKPKEMIMKRLSFIAFASSIVQVVAATFLLGCGVPEGEGIPAATRTQTVVVESAAPLSKSVEDVVVPISDDDSLRHQDRIPRDSTTETCNGECCRFVCDNGSTWINRGKTCGQCTDEGRAWCRYKGSRLEHAWWGPC